MARGPETRLVSRIVTAIKDAYPAAWVLKVHGNPYQPAGVPDLLVVLGGRLAALEVKAPRPGETRQARERRVTPLQRATMGMLRRAGAVVGMVDTVEGALALVGDLVDP